MSIKGSGFYTTQKGDLNKKILTQFAIQLNEFLIEKHSKDGSCLIMGYGDGLVVEAFRGKFDKSIVVEGAKDLFREVTKEYANLKNIEIKHSYFEDLELSEKEKVDVILGNHVLEHVDDPVEVLKKAKSWLKPDGIAIYTVPNAKSLHRRIGVELGILDSIYGMSQNDKQIGHQRVYDLESCKNDIRKAGCKILDIGGFNIKILSQKQMKDWSQELLQAMFKVSLEVPPEVCSNIYIVVSK